MSTAFSGSNGLRRRGRLRGVLSPGWPLPSERRVAYLRSRYLSIKPKEGMRLIQSRILEWQQLKEQTWLERQLLEVSAALMAAVRGRSPSQCRHFLKLIVCLYCELMVGKSYKGIEGEH